jgi:hypothetical protein
VEKHQCNLVYTAEETSAIATLHFPSNVRNYMLQKNESHDKSDRCKNHFVATSDTACSMSAESMKNDPKSSKPLASYVLTLLYTLRILLGLLTGALPEVFMLLETLYGVLICLHRSGRFSRLK